ncbi:AsmA family protein [Lichenicoccus sp.]|uniref:AsmA family protein n=1 Tax=Lichenicoccus sp. TaxID=2781899 RepID=UPI003D13B46B
MKAALAAGIVVLVVGIGAAALVDRSLDQDRLRRAVIGAIERQSGRTVTLQALRVRLLPSPRIDAQGFTLGNPDGDPEPVMLRLGEVQARLALWPLLRHVVRLDGLRIDHASLDLARSADGRANWQMEPRRRPAGAGGAPAGHARPWGVAFDSVQLLDASVSLRDRQAHRGGAVQVARLEGDGLQGERPSISIAGSHAGAGFTVAGEIGPLGRLFSAADRSSPWPISLRLVEQADGRTLAQGSLDGALADPRDGRGYDIGARYAVGQLADLNRLFSHARLPQVQGLAGSLHVIDAGGPRLTALHAQAGASVLPAWPGPSLAAWRVDATDPAAPVAIAASTTWRGRPVRLRGTAGTLQMLQGLRGASLVQAVLPVDLLLETDGASLHAAGRIGDGDSDFRLNATVADLPALLPGAPELGPVAAAARLRSQGGRVFRLSELSLGSGAGDLAGELGLTLGGHPALTGTLTSTRLDADRLSRWSGTPARVGAPKPAPARAPPGPARAAAAGPAPAGQPQHPVPWGWLNRADLDLAVRVVDLLVAGQSLHGFTAHAVLQGGRLLVDPVQAEGPAGPVSARFAADASAAPPHLEVTMHPLFVPAAALAGWLGQPVWVQGAAELVGALQAQGETRQALAASATGHAGVSMVNGRLDNDALLRLLGRSVPLSMALPKGGSTELRCLALHAGVADGRARFDTISLRTGRATVDGHGAVGLEDGSLDLRLVPFVALGGAGASMPVRIGGSLRQPRPAFDNQGSGDTRGLGGRTTLVIGPQQSAAADCDPALRAAREGVAGPAAVAAAAPPEHRHKNPKPLDILRGLGLFR